MSDIRTIFSAKKRVFLFLLAAAFLFLPMRVDGEPNPSRPGLAPDSEGDYLYRITLVQAAPGYFREFMDLMSQKFDLIEAQGDPRPFWMRHTQGDVWDFMIVYPMEDYDVYYGQDRLSRIARYALDWEAFESEEDRLTASHEDLFVRSAAWAELEPTLLESGYFHIEMFVALSGKRAELLQQRRMENAYLAAIDRPVNFIFVKEAGAGVDSFTLGCYQDIKHYAASADIPLEVEDEAARAAGFDGVSAISPYLRSLIARHHDTLAVPIN
jgi:hypothetical protein